MKSYLPQFNEIEIQNERAAVKILVLWGWYHFNVLIAYQNAVSRPPCCANSVPNLKRKRYFLIIDARAVMLYTQPTSSHPPSSAARQIDFCISLPPPIAARASHFPPLADGAVLHKRETLARAFLAYRSLGRQFISN
jgi:hypothetical protein